MVNNDLPKSVCKVTLIFERAADCRTFLESIGVPSTFTGLDATVMMPKYHDEKQTRLAVEGDNEE